MDSMDVDCSCCGDCEYFADDFDRADDTDIGASWTEESGDWEIVGNKLRCESDTGIALATATHPDSTPTVVVRADISSSYDFNEGRIIVDWVDASNYLFGAVLFSDDEGAVVVGEVVAGVTTYLSTKRISAPLNTPITLTVYLGEDEKGIGVLGAKVGADFVGAKRTGTSDIVGLGTGSIVFDPNFLEFDNFVIERHRTDDEADSSCPRSPYSCTVVDDDFDRDALGFGYSAASGSFTHTGTSVTTTSTSAVMLCNTIHPHETAAAHIASTIRGPTNAVIRFFVNYQDSANYHFAQITIDASGTVKLFARVAGVNTELVSKLVALSAGVDYTVQACFTDGHFSCTVNSVTAEVAVATPTSRRQVGFGTGATVPSAVTFQDFTFKRGYDANNTDCPRCNNSNCCPNTVIADQLYATFASTDFPEWDGRVEPMPPGVDESWAVNNPPTWIPTCTPPPPDQAACNENWSFSVSCSGPPYDWGASFSWGEAQSISNGFITLLSVECDPFVMELEITLRDDPPNENPCRPCGTAPYKIYVTVTE